MSLTAPVDESRDHVRGGSAQGAVTLLVYGDYECPYTRRAYRGIQRLERAWGEGLRFAFRHFPLREIHPHAQMASELAEEAAVQDRFWPTHDLLFHRQKALERDDLRRYAAELELNADRVATALEHGTHRRRIEEDLESGTASGVRGTPTLFIGDRLHDASYTEEVLDAALRAIGGSPS
jgi:protein-disulfide isomerase